MEIEIKEIESTRVAYMRYVGLPQKATSCLPKIFKSIKGKSSGAPIFYYLTNDPNKKEVEMEICVPTEETPNQSGVEVKILPHEKVLSTTWIGPYTKLPQAYQILMDYVDEHQIPVTGIAKEVYIKGPGMLMIGNPNKYVTEIHFILKNEE
ncbi:MAG: GyrI-like domain-containing protein [Anaerorhabdus sp.]|uniref:GyrI-like domain-containing protein n=1 Tax=Anaerorhabdus sp. TaxID=1872524 RepID=UPI002FCC10C2